MSHVDEAFEKAQSIVKDAQANLDGIRTEEDTKIQIILRLLTESLGWFQSDISAETKHENGYSDFILSNDNKAALLIEAKRKGSISVGTSEKDRLRELKIAGPALSDATAGIDQAANYATPNGLQVAVLTDGITWIIFKTFIPGLNFKTKEAVVFPSFEAILRDFSKFYDLISKKQFGKKIYNTIFDQIHQSRLILTHAPTAPLPEEKIKVVQKSKLAFDLDSVFSSFFDRLTGEKDEDLLIECFVETRESRIADFALEKITANVLGNLSPKDKDIDTELANLIESTVETDAKQTEAGETIFVVGPTGAGKSTFLERFFRKTLSPTLRRRCVVSRINCLDSSGREDTALNWLTDALIESFEAKTYADGSPSWDQLLGLYHLEYIRRSKGVDAHLYERDKQAFREKFGRFLEDKVESDREGYLKRILDDIVSNRKKLPIILIDNTDEFTTQFKKNVFQFAQSLRRYANHCILIFPVTDKSAWSFSKTDIFAIYQSRSFFLPTPAPREVFRKRIDFLKQRLTDDTSEEERRNYFAGRGIKVSIENLNKFASVLESIFVDFDYTAKTVGELSNYNIRRTLALSKRVITSSVLNIESLLNSYITGAKITPNMTKFMNALLKGDYDAFRKSDNHEIFPIFQIDTEIQHSPLLNLRILTLLDSTRRGSKTIDERHLDVQSIFGYFDALGCSEASVDRNLIALIEANLVEPYDASVRDLSAGQKLSITYSGGAHLRLATHDKIFFEQMALTTPILNPEVVEKIRSTYSSDIPFQEKMDSVRQEFYEYLISEDKFHMSINVEGIQYQCQSELTDKLGRFGGHKVESDSEDFGVSGGLEDSGVVAEAVIGTVDWFDLERGYGFVDIEDVEGQVYLNSEKLHECGIEQLSDGDDILCDVDRSTKGMYVSKIHDIETDPSSVETAECKIIRTFDDRRYGFVRLDGGAEDAFFHYSLFPTAERGQLKIGASFFGEIQRDKRGRGWQVKRIISLIKNT